LLNNSFASDPIHAFHSPEFGHLKSPAPAERVCTSFGDYTRNYLPTVTTVDSEIFVGR
jgi:hypothetical protein